MRSRVEAHSYESHRHRVRATRRVGRGQIIDEAGIKSLLHKLRGTSLYMVAVLGLATGMRRNEMLALRWCDIKGDKIRVERSLEQTSAACGSNRPRPAPAGARSRSRLRWSPSCAAIV